MALYGYVRVSTRDQVRGASLEEQERRVQGVALVRGEALAEVFREEGISGTKPLESRPAGAELLQRLRPGDTLVVAKLDRAFRNAADALTRAEAWRKEGIRLIVADMGTEPVTEDGAGRMFFGMLALVAEFERGRLLERTAEGKAAKRAKGGHPGGKAPFGYAIEGKGREARLVPLPRQQEAIATIRELRAGGMSLRRVAEEIRARHGLPVSHMTVKSVTRQKST